MFIHLGTLIYNISINNNILYTKYSLKIPQKNYTHSNNCY